MAGIFEGQKEVVLVCPNLVGETLNWGQRRMGKWLNTVRMGLGMFRHRAFQVSEVGGKKSHPAKMEKHLNWRNELASA